MGTPHQEPHMPTYWHIKELDWYNMCVYMCWIPMSKNKHTYKEAGAHTNVDGVLPMDSHDFCSRTLMGSAHEISWFLLTIHNDFCLWIIVISAYEVSWFLFANEFSCFQLMNSHEFCWWILMISVHELFWLMPRSLDPRPRQACPYYQDLTVEHPKLHN